MVKKIKAYCILLFPCSWIEWGIFFFFLISYGILGTYIATNSSLIFYEKVPYDAYFSFDNNMIVVTGGGMERHPFSHYLFDVIRKTGLFFSDGKTDATFSLVLAWLSNITVSWTMVLILKYFRNIIHLPLRISLLLLLFFGGFTTCILLSFTPETYTYTLFLLVLFNYYAGLRLKEDKNIGLFPMVLSGIAIGGLTVTNVVKVFIPNIFTRKLFWNWKKIGIEIGKAAISAGVFVALYLWQFNFNIHEVGSKIDSKYEKFSNNRNNPLWDMIYSWFFGGNILFPGFAVRERDDDGFIYKGIFMNLYDSIFQYIFIGILVVLILWSYVKNFKNRYVQILMISLVVDIIIHCVLTFGLHSSYIYGGHFVFVFPLLIGWLFFAYRNNPKIISGLSILIGIMIIYSEFNNIYRMQELFVFMKQYYPKF